MILHTFVISLPSLDMLGYFQVQAPGGFIFGGAIFYGGFFALPVAIDGLIHGGAYFWNFRVFLCIPVYRFLSQRKKQVVIEQTLIS